MSTVASRMEIAPVRARREPPKAVALIEVLAVFAGILLYIWLWQYSHPYYWMALLAVVLMSHVVHRDSLRTLGLDLHALLPSARIILPLSLMVLLPALVFGVVRGTVSLHLPDFKTLHYFGNYLLWCIFQQYLAQSFFHNRLMNFVENRHFSSLLVAMMFGAAHIPNPVLMVVTALGGWALAEVFARHRSIWPLALAQAAIGAAVGAIVPGAMIHNMRVGPGYFFYSQP